MNWIDKLVQNAYTEANKDNGGKPDFTSEGRCLASVENVLEKTLGIKAKRPGSAYQFPIYYDRYSSFLKYYTKVSNKTPLRDLPLGSIDVWNKTKDHPHGHIGIKTAHPSEFTSDYTQKTRTSYAGQTVPLALYTPNKI